MFTLNPWNVVPRDCTEHCVCKHSVQYSREKSSVVCRIKYLMNNQDMFIHIVARRGGGSLEGIIRDGAGVEIPRDQYVLEQDGDNFSFNFKKPFRPRSGRKGYALKKNLKLKLFLIISFEKFKFYYFLLLRTFRYTVVFSDEGGSTAKDIMVNFLGN